MIHPLDLPRSGAIQTEGPSLAEARATTASVTRAGDASWERTAAMHEDVVRGVLAGFGGREVETAGDCLRSRRRGAAGADTAGWEAAGATWVLTSIDPQPPELEIRG